MKKRLCAGIWCFKAAAYRLIAIALVINFFSKTLLAQENTRILFLLDASLSMKNEWKGGSKWNVAASSLLDIADSISKVPNVEMGLRLFGDMYPEPDKNCHDTRLCIGFDTNNLAKFRRKLEETRPKGITPLVYAIEKAALDFGDKNTKNIIIIITDGEDACDRDPCSVGYILQQHHVVLRPFIIGMSLQPNVFDKMSCMGLLFNSNNRAEFSAALSTAVLESIAKTTLQVNLNDAFGKPTETTVNMTFYDQPSNEPKYNLYHTLNTRGLPDTISISHTFMYRLQVHTIPPVFKDSIMLRRNTHNVISLKVPQGFLSFALQGSASQNQVSGRIKCLVHLPGKTETLNVQRINSIEKYLCGNYELEILTLPRLTVKNVKIEQSKTTDVLIPAPGILTINKGFDAYGGIFMVEKNEMKKIYDLHLKDKQETIALQPGRYHLVYRSKNARTIHTSVDKAFEILSNGSLSLKL